MRISRRSVLAGIGGVATVGAAAAGGVLLQPTVQRASQGALLALDGQRFSVLAAVAEAICPGGGGLPSASEVGVAEKVDRLLDSTHAGMAAEVVQLLDLLENPLVGLLLDGRPRPFTALSVADRTAVLERWRTSGIAQRRTGYRAVHGLCSAAYWADKRAWSHTGFPGLPSREQG